MANATLEDVVNAIQETVYCSGEIAVDPRNGILYYDATPTTPKKVNIFTASVEELEALSFACQPAPFGRGAESVLDDTYRKAGKLELDHFSTNFDLSSTGIPNIVRSQLLVGPQEGTAIRFELYKLNVYGEGGFFKSHKDTPRGENMFGSLVIIFPSAHEGGSLILRHNNHEWEYQSSKTVGNATHDKSHVGFIAFFSDVEHEVKPVTSGYRITLTYNLYSEKGADAPEKDVNISLGSESTVLTAMKALLLEKDFLPNGGRLGFGLSHQYPFAKTLPINYIFHNHNPSELVKWRKDLQSLIGSLKGRDAMIARVSVALGLRSYLRLHFVDDHIKCELLMDYFPGIESLYEESLTSRLLELGSELISVDEEYAEEFEEHPIKTIEWVVRPTKLNRTEEVVGVYGTEPSAMMCYGDVCLIVEVGNLESRGV